MNYSEMNTEELISLYKENTKKADEKKVLQKALKNAINSLYGALANKFFPMFNQDMARSITGNGRFFINLTGSNVDKYLHDLAKSEKPYWIYSDTDSVDGDTIIEINNKKGKISDFFDSLDGEIIEKSENNFIKKLNECESLSVNKSLELENKKVLYFMKHKVKKRMFKIKVKDNEVIITEDHSLMVVRNSKLISVKPKEVLNTDKSLILQEDMKLTLHNLQIEDLGIFEEFVYDLEIEDNHNFFGNDILVHNSCYFALNKIGDALSKDKTLRESKNTIDDFIESKIQPKVEESILEMKEVFNAVDDQKIGMKREVIFKGAVWLAKKKYFMRELDSEGIEYLDEDNPEIKKQGIEIVKSSTPPFSRKYLNDATLIILEKDKDTLRKWLKEVKEKFIHQKLMDIAKTSSVNSLDYDLDNDKFDENGRKISIPINSRSVLVTNRYIKENNLQLEHNLLTENEKIKMLYLKMPNPLNSDSFAFNTEKFAQLFKDYIDYDTNFEKLFLKPLELMTENLNYDLKNNNEVLDEW